MIDSKPESGKKFNLTLVQRFLIIFLFGFIITAGIIGANFVVGLALENNAIAINLSGNGRYRNYELYYLYDQLIALDEGPDRQVMLNRIKVKTDELEKILVALRSGSTEYRLSAAQDAQITLALDRIIAEFKTDIKPILLYENNNQKSQTILRNSIPKIVNEIDDVVMMFETSSVNQVAFLRKIQILFMAIILITAILTAILLVYWIERPIYQVIGGMKQLEQGNLDYRFKEKRADEIGLLIKGFNRMASEIKSKTNKLEKFSNELKRLSITDGLTGLYNHKHFYDLLEKELARAKRYERPLSVLFLDIDFFKSINDKFGHKLGDEVLNQVANLILANLRETDNAFRYGGEEFAVLLTETDQQDAFLVAQKTRELIERHKFVGSEGTPICRVTISIGISSFPKSATGCNELVIAADSALYAAKAAGRNRCILYEPVSNL